jgi:hypothetical protein
MTRIGKNRGKAWEREVAKSVGGVRMWSGPGSDVELGDVVVECKSQQDDDGLKTLTAWIRQAKGYSDRWALAVKLGLGVKAEKFVIISLDEYTRLLRENHEAIPSRTDAGDRTL